MRNPPTQSTSAVTARPTTGLLIPGKSTPPFNRMRARETLPDLGSPETTHPLTELPIRQDGSGALPRFILLFPYAGTHRDKSLVIALHLAIGPKRVITARKPAAGNRDP